MHSIAVSISLALLLTIVQSTPIQRQNYKDNDVHNIRHVSLGDHILKDKRVLVIGDVHGCMQNLLEVLEKAAVLTNDGSEKIINNAVVILAGDTINKGPDNLKVLRWLRRNIPTGRVYAVRGNHEDNVINNPDKYAWTKEATAEDLALLTTFPYTISIPLYDAIVVHAGLIPDRNLEDQTVFIMTRMRNIEVKTNGELIPHEVRTDPGENWGIVYSRMGLGKPHVYYGHDSGRGKNGTQRFGRATGLDTGCYKGRYLTGVILPVTKEEFYKSKC